MVSNWVDILGSPFVRQHALVCSAQKVQIKNREDVSFRIGILAERERVVKNLVFPHVQVKNNNQHNDTIVEPLPCDVNLPVLFLTEARQPEVEGRSVHSRKFDIQVTLEAGEFPILKKRQNVKNKEVQEPPGPGCSRPD